MDHNWGRLLAPVRVAGVAEAVVRQLGELMGAGVLRAGDRLPSEMALADHFGVAPMTVRNALQVLRDYELIETRRGRHAGSFVHPDIARTLLASHGAPPTVAEFTDFTLWREVVSGEASALAAERIDDAQVARLRALADESHAPGIAMPVYRFADAALHLFIAEITGSGRLVEAERQIQDHLTRTLAVIPRAPDPAVFALQGHEALVRAIVERRPDEARRHLRDHVRATLDLLVGVSVVQGGRAAADVQAPPAS